MFRFKSWQISLLKINFHSNETLLSLSLSVSQRIFFQFFLFLFFSFSSCSPIFIFIRIYKVVLDVNVFFFSFKKYNSSNEFIICFTEWIGGGGGEEKKLKWKRLRENIISSSPLSSPFPFPAAPFSPSFFKTKIFIKVFWGFVEGVGAGEKTKGKTSGGIS